ncbi:hypothetical protein IGI46_005061 [Enterococcus sp. AZ163]
MYIRDLDPTLNFRLEQLADEHKTSVNKMAKALLEKSLKESILSDELSELRDMRNGIESLSETVREFLSYNIELVNLAISNGEGER